MIEPLPNCFSIWAIAAATVVFLALNMVEQLDNFIDSRVPAGVVFRYYLLYIPYIVYLVLPVAMLLATLFTVGGMALSNELSAMHVSGVPFIRPMGLLLATAGVMSLFGFAIGETAVPAANRMRMDIERYEVKRLPRETRVRGGRFYLQIQPGKHIRLDRYNPPTREAFGVGGMEVADGRIRSRWDADKMIWLDGAWRIRGASEQTFSADGSVTQNHNVALDLTGAGLRPDELERVQTAPEEMNWRELGDFIARLKSAGGNVRKWEVDRLFKVSLPVASIIIVLFGAPIASVKRRGGTALGFGLALFVCFMYFGFMQVGKVLGHSGALPPLLSAWIGNIFFGLLGIGAWWHLSR
jgi:lipopolysaccharide export system permease protein